MIAVDMDTGRVNWVYWAHKYDAWNHACGAPDLYGWSTVVPALFPVPLANGIANCTQTPIGPDMGFGQQPKLVKNVKLANGKRGDVVVAGITPPAASISGAVQAAPPMKPPPVNGAGTVAWPVSAPLFLP